MGLKGEGEEIGESLPVGYRRHGDESSSSQDESEILSCRAGEL